ncbi:hypothetical protein pb186bvf_005046 [Paramecium bursaria]
MCCSSLFKQQSVGSNDFQKNIVSLNQFKTRKWNNRFVVFIQSGKKYQWVY